MKYLKKYKLFESIKDKHEPLIRDILTDIIADGINVDIKERFLNALNTTYISIVISKYTIDAEDYSECKFDITKYKDDYFQLINYMEGEGYTYECILYKYSERFGIQEYCSTYNKYFGKDLSLEDILEISLKDEIFSLELRFNLNCDEN